jgi:hypothetical protein
MTTGSIWLRSQLASKVMAEVISLSTYRTNSKGWDLEIETTFF